MAQSAGDHVGGERGLLGDLVGVEWLRVAPTPLARETRELYANTMRGSADLDISAVVRGASRAKQECHSRS